MNAKLFWQNVQWQVWPQINPRVWRIGFHGWAGRKGRASFSTFWRSRKMKFSIFNLLMEPLLYICSWMKRIMSSNLNKGRLVHHLYCIQAVYITEFTSRWNKGCVPGSTLWVDTRAWFGMCFCGWATRTWSNFCMHSLEWVFF